MLEEFNLKNRYVRVCFFKYSESKMAEPFANGGDPDQMPNFAASDLGLHNT